MRMGGLALVTVALLASCCLSQSRELKQSLNDIESIVNTFVPPNDRAALYQAASTVISSIPGGAGALGGIAGGSRGPTLAPVNGNSTNASSQGAFCTSCGPSPAGSPPSSAPATNSQSPTLAPSGGSKGAFDTSPVASTPPATQG